ncbi:MAG: DNA-processing protein DprA, partial [Cyanobacteriota bacterium]|nr:DNA-processing protein DprA [Cyanobacteriota bacterium]
NLLAQWLLENKMRPKDLLAPNIKKELQTISNDKLNPTRIQALLERGVMLGFAVERWTNQGLWIIGRGDAEYPKLLKHRLKHSAPAILYGVGNQDLLYQKGLAVVGSRDIDQDGLEYTQKIAQTCAEENIQVISGGARGVDQASMLGVLEADGTAVGVLADSLIKAATLGKYRPYIRARRLTLISAYDPNARFTVGNAMGRNKYIYALADHALVISSSVEKGGTWAGAMEVLKKMPTVPLWVRMENMQIENKIPEGNQKLIEQGGRPFKFLNWDDSLLNLLSQPPELVVQEIAEQQTIDFDKLSEPQVEISENLDTIPFENSQDLIEQNNLDEKQTPPVSPTEEIYEAVLPIILKHLQQPLTHQSLAQLLTTQSGQMKEWLQKAKKAGLVKTQGKEYLLVDQDILSETQTEEIYQAVLPIILKHLQEPIEDKALEERLNVKIGQVREWLKRSVNESKVIKQSKTYVLNSE